MTLNENLHQTVTRFGSVGFSMYVCMYDICFWKTGPPLLLSKFRWQQFPEVDNRKRTNGEQLLICSRVALQ